MAKLTSPAILATICLPWSESFELDRQVFRNHIIRHLQVGIRRLYLFGTAGEGYAVTTDQFRQAAQLFAETTDGKAELRQLGVISLSLPLIQERIEIGRSVGINSFQLSFPSWARLNDRDMAAFFAGICDRNPDCDFLFYNVARGLRTLTPAELGELSRRHANLTAVKWAVPLTQEDYLKIADEAPLLMHYFTDIAYCEARLLGVPGSLLVALSAAVPSFAQEIFQLGQQRSDDDLLRQRIEQLQLHRQIIRSMNAAGGRVDGAYDKLFCRLQDPAFSLRMLTPYHGFGEADFERYRSELREKLPEFVNAVDQDAGALAPQ
ncbi:dihydrodipicolinate synthase family protein [Planctomicrobium sp. SH664]|uniref:dihydrodipicolinate synthase family protein n=1 Tax=Planctomicrobium sp. SH664 TaxID=3448125 RepID=UPI003F5BE6C8